MQKKRPVVSFHRAQGDMDLFAAFSFAAVKGCAGQGSARRQHYPNPKGDIAVVAGLRTGDSTFILARFLRRCIAAGLAVISALHRRDRKLRLG